MDSDDLGLAVPGGAFRHPACMPKAGGTRAFPPANGPSSAETGHPSFCDIATRLGHRCISCKTYAIPEPFMADFDPDAPPPKNLADWREAVWYRLGSIHTETRLTNGRVTRLERTLLIAVGVLTGLAFAYNIDLPYVPFIGLP